MSSKVEEQVEAPELETSTDDVAQENSLFNEEPELETADIPAFNAGRIEELEEQVHSGELELSDLNVYICTSNELPPAGGAPAASPSDASKLSELQKTVSSLQEAADQREQQLSELSARL
ncbi:MAG: hypothetical protein ACPGEF_08035, partial [Endozoicomonas sp.]